MGPVCGHVSTIEQTLVDRTAYHSQDDKVLVRLFNHINHVWLIKKGTVVARAETVNVVPESEMRINQLIAIIDKLLPEHVQRMFAATCEKEDFSPPVMSKGVD